MVSEAEYIKRMKWKLQLYGSYTREKEMLEHRYFEIKEELKMNDLPQNAAKNLGFYGDGPYHPAVDKMKLEEASLIDEISQLESEISYLGIDDYLNGLNENERLAVDEKYVRNNTIRNIGNLIGKSKSAVHRMLDKFPKNS